MDKHTFALILGIALVAVGAYMAFNEKHFNKTSWKSTGLSKGISPERAKGLAKFQGVVIICVGIHVLYLALFK
jgi:hypothetical protein